MRHALSLALAALLLPVAACDDSSTADDSADDSADDTTGDDTTGDDTTGDDGGDDTTVPDAAPAASGLRVNEVAAAGDPADWIEVINTGATSVVLADYVFADQRDDLTLAHAFPAITLAPGERHVEEVTDEDDGFKLGGDEEVWIFLAATEAEIDGTDWDEGAAPAGGSWARIPDGTGEFQTVTTDTRGEPNE